MELAPCLWPYVDESWAVCGTSSLEEGVDELVEDGDEEEDGQRVEQVQRRHGDRHRLAQTQVHLAALHRRNDAHGGELGFRHEGESPRKKASDRPCDREYLGMGGSCKLHVWGGTWFWKAVLIWV